MERRRAHIWLGYFENENDLSNFVAEDPAYYADESDAEELYISEFAKTQGEHWMDHDFMEHGFEDGPQSFTEKFADYSYASEWIPQIVSRTDSAFLQRVNTLILFGIDAGYPGYRGIQPSSVNGGNFFLEYMGEVTYEL
ncbi:MAG: immunity 22 family protein [Chitinophaga sp.]|uniref:immunity 22 family protein n=1 Tax=Chitinophaga sp. TaxID=1869181 RepID=UPI0025BC6384|nr:immunity 22 family protein [Chitinophaga sp.]MBV8252380.1 immunity 22 family protein [Chitinophaga sp.]